jgi:hypothetical protein
MLRFEVVAANFLNGKKQKLGTSSVFLIQARRKSVQKAQFPWILREFCHFEQKFLHHF